jgi:hypothetical protein
MTARLVLAVLALVVVYVVVFTVGTSAMVPASLQAMMPTDADTQTHSALAVLVMALVDTLIVAGVVRTSRLRGARLWALVALVFWGSKTFSSQLEAWVFMPNVTAGLVPALMAMTVPLAVVFPGLAVVLLGRWRGPEERPAFRVPSMPATQWAWKSALLCVVVYPLLFFVFGYYVAFSNEEVRAFYGGVMGPDFLTHMRGMAASTPWLFPFEWARAALWVAMAVALIWSTRGNGWLGGLWAALFFGIIQNDVHAIPNPLMSPTVQFFHFLETVPSNMLNALAITALMTRAHGRQEGLPAGHAPGAGS